MECVNIISLEHLEENGFYLAYLKFDIECLANTVNLYYIERLIIVIFIISSWLFKG